MLGILQETNCLSTHQEEEAPSHSFESGLVLRPALADVMSTNAVLVPSIGLNQLGCFHLCFWIVVLEKTLESPLDSKEIKPVNPKGNQPWIFIGRTDAEAPILWPFDVKSQLIGKEPDDGKDWRQEEKRTTEDEMVGWHHQLNGHEFEQALGVGDGQGSLECCSPWGHKESDTTEWLNWTDKLFSLLF